MRGFAVLLALLAARCGVGFVQKPTLPGRAIRPHVARAPKLAAMVDGELLSHVLTGLADADVANAAAAAATDAASQSDGGWFDGLVNLILGAIKLCDGTLEATTGQKSFGASIVLFTVFLKALTYPLTYSQLESTSKMQAIAPKLKEVQEVYKSNPEVMQREIQMLYSSNNINPLAGCLPSLVQLPVFIALYRALLKLANTNQLDEPFLWLPNLEGPVYGAQNMDWLTKWTSDAPPLGWHDTLCFLSLPVILVVSQTLSQKLLQPPTPKDQDEAAAASQQIIQYLPFMVGFFALNVPSGLAVYWIANNIITTALSVLVKQKVAEEMSASGLALSTPTASVPITPPAMPAGTASNTILDAVEVNAAPALGDVEGFGSSSSVAGPMAASDSGPFGDRADKPKKAKKKKRKARK